MHWLINVSSCSSASTSSSTSASTSSRSFTSTGKLLMYDFAAKSVRKGGPLIGIRCTDGIILCAIRKSLSLQPLLLEHPQKIFQLDEHLCIGVTGLLFEGQLIANKLARQIANHHRNLYDEPIPLQVLAEELSTSCLDVSHEGRPLAAAFLIAGWDAELGYQVYVVDPVGAHSAWSGVCIGGGEKSDKILAEIDALINVNVKPDNSTVPLPDDMSGSSNTIKSHGNGTFKKMGMELPSKLQKLSSVKDTLSRLTPILSKYFPRNKKEAMAFKARLTTNPNPNHHNINKNKYDKKKKNNKNNDNIDNIDENESPSSHTMNQFSDAHMTVDSVLASQDRESEFRDSEVGGVEDFFDWQFTVLEMEQADANSHDGTTKKNEDPKENKETGREGGKKGGNEGRSFVKTNRSKRFKWTALKMNDRINVESLLSR